MMGDGKKLRSWAQLEEVGNWKYVLKVLAPCPFLPLFFLAAMK
jgi:hypothetical protein